MDPAFDDEFLSINAIYTASTLTLASTNPTICTLALPSSDAITLRLEFPLTYPNAPPSILGTQSVGNHVAKGSGQHIVELARLALAELYEPGSPCIYDLVEELSQRLPQPASSTAAADQGGQEPQAAAAERHGQQNADSLAASRDSDSAQDLNLPNDLEPPWIVSDVATEKKSVFVARAASVASPAEARSFLRHLLATDKKVAKATHNITAWRVRGPGETAFQDCDDDGETAAGGRVLHLMQLMDVWDVMVVVSRWYGGVQLGPDRFRLINSTARDALGKGGFINEVGKEGKSEGGKKKGKK